MNTGIYWSSCQDNSICPTHQLMSKDQEAFEKCSNAEILNRTGLLIIFSKSSIEVIVSLKQIDFKRASGMIGFSTTPLRLYQYR
jgi:hypothetical protein